jgi:1-acyl-sn-glycerol-3-phosphate acyltransferase
MRSLLFNLLYRPVSGVYVALCAVLALVPGRWAVAHGIRSYCRLVVLMMRTILGIRVEVRGTPPRNRPVVIAAKHQSWADGMVMVAKTGDINFVAGDHMRKFPLIGWVFSRMGAIVLSNGGGPEAAKHLQDGIERSHAESRPVLIYPEGHLTKVGESERYRTGVYRLASALDRETVPVATNMGLFWPQQDWTKHKGVAVIEFLDPIAPDQPRQDFMAQLEDRIETRTRALEAEGAA